MIERILCPTNLPPDSDEALRFAASLAGAYNAKLFVCGYHMALSAPVAPSRAAGATNKRLQKLLTESLPSYFQSGARFDWESIVLESGEEIAQAASERRVDLIVINARRRDAPPPLLDPLAELLTRTAPCPVLVTPSQGERGWEGETTGVTQIRRALVAHDFSSGSELALRLALQLAQKFRAELHLLHVLPEAEAEDVAEIAWRLTNAESPQRRAMRRLQDSVPAEAYLWCRVLHATRRGKPYREVLGYVDEEEIDLVCMGAHGRDFGLGAFFGSNADRVLRQSPCPVLVARPLKPASSAPVGARAGSGP